ncbi:MAG: aldehyde dehydrogenase family protein [Anaerolineales bacterium]|nr:aldehyde dehydrogenase family protein [Anaerolineales bacterium]
MTEKLAFVNPATGVQFGEVSMTTPEGVKQAVQEMRQAFPAWSQKTVKERANILHKLQRVLIDAKDEISEVLNQDCGKSRQDGLLELFIAVDMLVQYRWNAAKWLKRKRVDPGLYIFKRCYVEYRPYGVTAIIAPWNYPFTLSIPPVIAALLAGNTVVLKPSEVTAATGVLIEKLFSKVPELAPFIRVVHGDGKVGAALVNSKPDYIFMTGSTATGKKIMQTASETLTPVALELGGKDAMIVLEDADLQAAARWGAWGAFFNTGQTCMAVERVYVVESKYDEFTKLAVQQAEELKSGYSTEPNSPYFMGPITDPRQVKIIDDHLKDASEKGAKILIGGKKNEGGMFYNPIVLVDVDHSMKIMRDETFGPIMPIMKVRDEEEALRLANDNAYGLGASVWSKDIDHAKRVADRVEAGSIIINDSIAQFGVPMLPFGGTKDSGFGRTHGEEGLKQFTRPYSFAIGGAPVKIDIATILREMGHYRLATLIMGVLYGTTFKQKWEALTQFFKKEQKESSASKVKSEAITTK